MFDSFQGLIFCFSGKTGINKPSCFSGLRGQERWRFLCRNRCRSLSGSGREVDRRGFSINAEILRLNHEADPEHAGELIIVQ